MYWIASQIHVQQICWRMLNQMSQALMTNKGKLHVMSWPLCHTITKLRDGGRSKLFNPTCKYANHTHA